MKRLTERQKRFVDAYIETGNASEAYRQAGYSSKNADVDGSKLLVNPSISREIKRRLADIESEKTATLEETLIFVTSVLRGEINEQTVLSVGNGRAARVEQIETPPKIKDRLKAAEYLLKIHGAFREKESEPTTPTEIRIIRAGASNTE